jgi:hypothetical protein
MIDYAIKLGFDMLSITGENEMVAFVYVDKSFITEAEF